MPVPMMLTDGELQGVADEALRGAMRDFPFEGAEVTSALDWSDEPSIYVVAKLGAGVPPLEGAAFSQIHQALHEAFLARGEERFPYFRLRRADDEATDEDHPLAGSP